MNFDSLTRYLDSLPGEGVPGCDLTIWINHEPVYRHMAGEGHPGQPIKGDETYWLYSATKVFTMTAAMQLVEKGLLRLDDPVSKYLPAYANLTVRDGDEVRPAKTVLTVQHLMSMQGGLDYDLEAAPIKACLEKYGDQATTRQLVDSFAESPLHFDPGTHYLYSLCHDVVAAIIEVVSGKTFAEYVSENIIEPLGMKTMTFHPTEEQFSRVAARYQWDENEKPVALELRSNRYAFTSLYESGGAGLMGDVESYILLTDALANGGVGKSGARILTQASIDEMRTDRLSEVSRKDFDQMGKRHYSYGLGVRTLVDAEASPSPVGEFGWDGAAGAWTMIDPDNHIAAFYAQHVLSCGRVYSEFHYGIRDRIYEGLNA